MFDCLRLRGLILTLLLFCLTALLELLPRTALSITISRVGRPPVSLQGQHYPRINSPGWAGCGGGWKLLQLLYRLCGAKKTFPLNGNLNTRFRIAMFFNIEGLKCYWLHMRFVTSLKQGL
jgi:hypothetical protein